MKFQQFGKYTILKKLAGGGMAEIFLACDLGPAGVGRFLAVKKALARFSKNAEFIDMFKNEGRAACNLKHGNIAPIYEFGLEGDQLYLAMEYISGANLRELMRKTMKSPFDIPLAVYIVKEAAAGLNSAHNTVDSNTGRPLHLIHRDVSPQNIMISFDGEVKIIDFGIAKIANTDLTKAGNLKGKFGYMSPEQTRGEKLDPRADIFCLGIVLWELLTNKRLFKSENEMATLRKVQACNVPKLQALNPQVPSGLEKAVMKSLAKNKNARYKTALDFERDLSRILTKTYPEFDRHDFADFIKTVYAKDIIKEREVLKKYSKQFKKYMKQRYEHGLSLSAEAGFPPPGIEPEEEESGFKTTAPPEQKQAPLKGRQGRPAKAEPASAASLTLTMPPKDPANPTATGRGETDSMTRRSAMAAGQNGSLITKTNGPSALSAGPPYRNSDSEETAPPGREEKSYFGGEPASARVRAGEDKSHLSQFVTEQMSKSRSLDSLDRKRGFQSKSYREDRSWFKRLAQPLIYLSLSLAVCAAIVWSLFNMETLSAYLKKKAPAVSDLVRQTKGGLSAKTGGAEQRNPPANSGSSARKAPSNPLSKGRLSASPRPADRLPAADASGLAAGTRRGTQAQNAAGADDPAARQTTVFVRTRPSGALVYVNRRFAARTPGLVKIPFSSRALEILIFKKGYAPKTVSAPNSSALSREINVRLKRRSPASY